MAIRRNISVLNPGIIADINIVYGSNLIPIEFYITDYVLPDNAIAILYCETSDKQLLKDVGTITNNVISFSPANGFFTVGKNSLQIRIVADEKNLYTFEMGANCKPKIATDDAQEVESQPTLVEQLITRVGETNALAERIGEESQEAIDELREENETTADEINAKIAQLSNPNIFINGNFRIWSNGDFFPVQNEDTEVVTPVLTADNWYVENLSVHSLASINVEKTDNGLYMTSSEGYCKIYQILDDETYNAIRHKTLTLSYEYTQPYAAEDTSVYYETHKEVRQITASQADAYTFASDNAIQLMVNTHGTTLHWVKLEVGKLNTPCIPDSKDAIICNLERRVRKTMHLTFTDTVSAWGNVNLNIEASEYIVKSIYNSDNIYIVLPYVSSNGKWSANIRTNSYGSTDFVCPVGETLTLEVYYEEIN